MIHPDTELRFINDQMGFGVFATRFIPRGTITWVLDDLDCIYSPEVVFGAPEAMRETLLKYCYRNNQGNFVLCWDHGRFVNHSFHSNCLSTAHDFEIAIRDIQAGEELTDDYGYLNVLEPFRANDEGTRRKIVYPDDLLRYHGVWDRKILAAARRCKRVSQPLLNLLPESTQTRLEAISSGNGMPDSVLTCYCPDHAADKEERRNAKARHRERIPA